MGGYRLRVEPISLLTEDLSGRLRVNPTLLNSRCIPEVRPKLRRHDRKELRTALAGILAAGEEPPPSMHRIAMRLQCHQTYLARVFPDLVAELKARHQFYFGIHKQVRSQMVRGLVRSATIDVHASGEYPSATRVCSGLPRFVDMRDAVAREEWKKTLRELGLDHENN
jgi:hypothetical protein